MSRTSNRPALACVALAALLGGCTVAGPRAAPSVHAPQQFINERGVKQWDRPEAFGPVPRDMLSTGKEYCATLNNGGKRYAPTGYHPQARDADGFPFEDGGFYCVQQ